MRTLQHHVYSRPNWINWQWTVLRNNKTTVLIKEKQTEYDINYGIRRNTVYTAHDEKINGYWFDSVPAWLMNSLLKRDRDVFCHICIEKQGTWNANVIFKACFKVSEMQKCSTCEWPIAFHTYQTKIILIKKKTTELFTLKQGCISFLVSLLPVSFLTFPNGKDFSPYLLIAFLRYCWSHLVLGLMQTSRSLFLSLALRRRMRKRI